MFWLKSKFVEIGCVKFGILGALVLEFNGGSLGGAEAGEVKLEDECEEEDGRR